MRTKLIIALSLMAGSLVALAQTNSLSFTNQLGSDAKAASSNVPGQQYPKIDSGRHAEFLKAPEEAAGRPEPVWGRSAPRGG